MINYNQINDNALVVVNISRPTNIYTFVESETGKEEIERAIQRNKESIETWSQYPDNEQFQLYLKEDLKANYKIMTLKEFDELQKKYYLDSPITEITEEKYIDMLEVLPPLKWTTIKGIEEFLICEMLSGTYTNQYAKCNGKYYTKVVDSMDQNTWIHNLL